MTYLFSADIYTIILTRIWLTAIFCYFLVPKYLDPKIINFHKNYNIKQKKYIIYFILISIIFPFIIFLLLFYFMVAPVLILILYFYSSFEECFISINKMDIKNILNPLPSEGNNNPGGSSSSGAGGPSSSGTGGPSGGVGGHNIQAESSNQGNNNPSFVIPPGLNQEDQNNILDAKNVFTKAFQPAVSNTNEPLFYKAAKGITKPYSFDMYHDKPAKLTPEHADTPRLRGPVPSWERQHYDIVDAKMLPRCFGTENNEFNRANSRIFVLNKTTKKLTPYNPSHPQHFDMALYYLNTTNNQYTNLNYTSPKCHVRITDNV